MLRFNTGMRAALYLRQSVDAKDGIERQRALTTALATQRGWDVAETYEDNATSATSERGTKSDWARMLKDAETGRFEVVVSVDLDRLLRRMSDLQTLTDTGLAVATVSGEIDLTSADGLFRAQMLAAIAQFEGKRRAERMERAADQRAASGKPHAGKRPFGWQADRVTLLEEEAAVVRDMTATLINGGTVRGICRDLNARGVLTSQGNRWTPQMIRKVVERPRNAGLLERKGEIQATSLIEPAVSREDWELVCAVLAGRSVKRGPQPEGNWLSGILTCVCGAGMHTKHVGQRGPAGTRVRVRTYQCGDPHRTGTGHTTIRADIAEQEVTGFMFGLLLDDRLKARDEADIRAVQQELADLAQDRADATDALLERGADKARVRARLASIQAATEAAEARRAQLVASGSALQRTLDAMPWDWGNDAEENEATFAFAWDDVPFDVRRELTRTALTVQVVKGGKGAQRLKVTAL